MPKAAQFFPAASELATERGVELEVYQCPNCGLTQLGGEPVPYFRDVVRASAFSEEMRGFRLEQFARFVQTHSLTGKKVLEVGCGRGEYLTLMRQQGAAAFGLEHAPEAVAACRRDGLQVEEGFIENAERRLVNVPFDAFFMMNFLEHLPDPGATLQGIANNLTNDGVGLVEVPNFDMIVRNRLFTEFIPDHLCYFTKETLALALRLNGFEVLTCDEIWHDYIISAIVRKRRGLDLSSFSDRHVKLQQELHAHCNRFGDKRVAVWGAGHQALTVLALARLEDKVKYVVDSAPFKQGRFTPATHLPIVPPTALDSDPVDAVIVMAAAYSDEVAQLIRRDHAPEIHIAILREDVLEMLDGT
jgi:SAM-dependent methyltransferase